jgi:hypothetical protein
MTRYALNNKLVRIVAAGAIALMLIPAAEPVLAQRKLVTAETLLDRIQIEDFLAGYYFDLSRGESHALSEYFTEDAVLDVDGTVATGHDEITKLYQPTEEAQPARTWRGHMLLNNPIIEIDGDKATAHLIWTGVMNEGVGKAPSLYEQGREYTELVKRDGKWLISKRMISSDSGLPDRFDATYEQREHP